MPPSLPPTGYIVTIDGPAGAGKSTIARTLAERLGIAFLDTGALYRTVTLAAARRGVAAADAEAVRRLLAEIAVAVVDGAVHLDGEDVSGAIRTPQVTAAIGGFADNPDVRAHLNDIQRQVAQACSLVTEGRDQGTIVFPDAQTKFFVTASERVRALRRQADHAACGRSVPLDQILADQRERDRNDAARDIAPLRAADDAHVLDTSDMTPEQVVDAMETAVVGQMANGSGPTR